MSTTSTSTSSRCAPPPPWSPCPERAGRRGYHALVSEPPDQELLEAWRAGDRDSGTALFRRYFRQLRRFFYNKVPEGDVEDLMQRTFIALVETPSGFRGESSFRCGCWRRSRRGRRRTGSVGLLRRSSSSSECPPGIGAT